jgi:hypothetical protein
MRLKKTNKRMKKKGGDYIEEIIDNFLKASLLKILKQKKNVFLNEFIESTNVKTYSKMADYAIRFLPNRVFKALAASYIQQHPLMRSIIDKKYLTKENARTIVDGINTVLNFLKDDKLIKSILTILYFN